MLSFGAEVGRYRIGAVLGTGRLTRVYSATHIQLGSRHAIKLFLDPHPGLQQLMLQEGRAQGRLSHPNIVGVTDVIRLPDGYVGLVMEQVEGLSLERWMRAHGAFSIDAAAALLGQILDGVGEAHRQGVVHGDLRPAAILLSQDARTAKVADFGIGQLPYQLRGLGLTPDSSRWLAPEQREAPGSATIASDIFSLGSIFAEMISGVPAMDETTGQPTGAHEVLPDCPVHIVSLLRRALSPDPDARFQSCSEMLSALLPEGVIRPALAPVSPQGATLIPDETLLQTIYPQEDHPQEDLRGPPAPPARPPRRRSAGQLLALLGMLGLTGFFGWWLGASREPIVSAPAEAAPEVQPPAPADEPPVQVVITLAEEPPEPAEVSEPVAAAPRPEPVVPRRERLPPPVEPVEVELVEAEPVEAEALAEVEPVVEPEARVVAPLDVLGSWTGRFDGRPCTLRITGQEGEQLAAIFLVQLGSTQRRFTLTGTLHGSRMVLTDGGQIRITASIGGGGLSDGTIRIGRKEEQGWSATL